MSMIRDVGSLSEEPTAPAPGCLEGMAPGGFRYEIAMPRSHGCVLCGAMVLPVLTRADAPGASGGGICEACTAVASAIWRRRAGEAVPGYLAEASRVREVHVLVLRRREVPRADAGEGEDPWISAPPELGSSYEHLASVDASGRASPPSAILLDGESIASAAKRALEQIGFRTWDSTVEELIACHTPRGRRVSVVLARAWGIADPIPPSPSIDRHLWKPWPPSEDQEVMASFWDTIAGVFLLRLHNHLSSGGRPIDLSVRMRRAACMYADLQIALRQDRTVDASMAVALRASMSEDELAIDEMIRRAEGRMMVSGDPNDEDDDEGGDADEGEDEDDPGEGDDGPEDEIEGAEDGETDDDPTFARPRPRRVR